jgi:hypothetical protein
LMQGSAQKDAAVESQAMSGLFSLIYVCPERCALM